MLITSLLASAAPSPETHAPPALPPSQPFASLLRQNQAAKPAPTMRPVPAPLPPRAAEPAKAAPSAPTPAAAKPNDVDSSARVNTRTADAKSPDKDTTASDANTADAAPADTAEAHEAKPAKATDDTSRPDNALAQWLLGQQLPAGASEIGLPGARGVTAGDAAGDDADASDATGGTARGRQRLHTLGRGDGADDTARRTEALQQKADAIEGDRTAATLREPNTHDAAAALALLEKPGERLPKPAALDAAAATAMIGATAAVRAAHSAAPATTAAIQLQTPLDAPDFTHALGAQLSVLAKDGVQRAELRLNPAEMGPVSVHIVMAGSHARIDFGADLAATRQILEAGLPELAGALREAGLTLSGGGVSQHAHGRDDGDGSAGSGQGLGNGSGNSGATDATAPHPLRRIVSAGGVDLYA